MSKRAESATPTAFTVDGVDYTISYRMAQQKAFQREVGEPVVSALVSMETTPGDMVRISALFRFGLTPQVGEDAADDIIDRIGIARTMQLITSAAEEAFKGLADPQKGPPAK